MSLLFDQHLSRRLPALFAADFPGSEQVILAGLDGADDLTIWNYSAGRGLAIVSKDSDFRDLSLRLGPPPKVIRLLIGNCSTKAIASLIRASASAIAVFLADPATGLLEIP